MFEDLLNSLFQQTKSPARRRRRGGQRLDKLQSAADVAGIADQTGVVDLANAAVSAMRALRSKDPKERREHWKDVGIRTVSAIPVVGDLAKLARMRKYADLTRGSSLAGKTARQAAKQPGSGFAGRVQKLLWPSSAAAVQSGARRSLGQSQAAAVPPSGRQPQGLSPSEMMGMMGKSQDEIKLADKQKRAKEQELIAEEDAKEALSELTEKVKSLTQGFGSLALAIVAMPNIVQRWSRALVESRQHLAAYDGRLAAAYALLTRDRFVRDVTTARDTGGSSAELVRQLSELEEALKPLEKMGITVTNILAILTTMAAKDLASVLTGLIAGSGIGRIMRLLEEWLGGNREANMPLHTAVERMIREGERGGHEGEPLPHLW